MNKRGQLTTIVIIAVVAVAASLLAFFLFPSIRDFFVSREKAEQILASQIEPFRDYIADCIEEASYEFFEKAGMQAGYYEITGLSSLHFAGKDYIVVVFKDAANHKINKLPSLGQIEMQYQLFLEREGNSKIDSCVKKAKFKLEAEPKERKLRAEIHDDAIIIRVDWPILVRKRSAAGTIEQLIEQKQVMLLIPLGYLWKAANTIVDCETKKDCKYEAIEWDKHTWNNPFSLRYVNKEARSLNKDQIVFLLESIPYRPGEKAYKFNFAIDRS
ncbi:MAG: hypothetical protein NZ889_01910 [Candidatus Pacearchaeota archaeon]|nr:hypothetical protein [Candidatus Pacearchaeota archaeon]